MCVSSVRWVHVVISCLTVLTVLLAAGACGTGTADSGEAPETSATAESAAAPETTETPETTAETETADVRGITTVKEAVSTKRTQERALEGCEQAELPPTRDTWSYARDYGLSREVADRRMDLQMCLSEDLYLLERNLKRNEGDNFAGFWAAHEPEYRYVFLFTENGLQTIQPYIEDEPYAPLLEIRSGADASLAELSSAQREAGRIVDRLDFRADTNLDIMKNRAEVYVTDRARFRSELRKAGLRLPEHVTLIKVEALSQPTAS